MRSDVCAALRTARTRTISRSIMAHRSRLGFLARDLAMLAALKTVKAVIWIRAKVGAAMAGRLPG